MNFKFPNIDYAKGLISKLKKEEYFFAIVMALSVGVITGFASVGFILVLNQLHGFLNGLAMERNFIYFLLPAVGGLLVGPIIRFVAPEAKGHGVSNVIVAVSLERGKIRPIVAFAKMVSSTLSIGSGGSCGREGPIVQIGPAIGSACSQCLGLNERRTITLLASGAAAGISATFNAPIAGVIFATEIIMKKAGVKEFGSIVVASVASSVISHSFLGDSPAFLLSKYEYTPSELPFYLLLGALCAVIAISFTWIFHKTENIFEKIKIDWTFKPAIGGFFCGIFLYITPEIYGSGFPAITHALEGSFPIKMLLILLVAKVFATSFTLGSGGSGGLFAPLLFLGAVCGGLFEKIAFSIFPSVVSGHGAYAVVGMAAFFAAAAHSPVTSIILIFEMTRDYNMILPLMFATVFATVVANKISKSNIYNSKLLAMGIDPDELSGKNLFERISVEEAMIPETHLVKVPAYMPIRDLESYFHMKDVKRCLVIDSLGKLFGIVNIKDLYKRQNIIDTGIIADICSQKVVTMRADDSLEDATMVFGHEPYHTIPVVDSFDSKKIVGLLRREDIISAYSNALKNKNVMDRFLKSRKIEKATSAELLEIRVSANYKCVGKKLSDTKLPNKCTVVTIFRNKEQIIPDGKTEIIAGDNLVILCSDADKVIKILREG